MHLNPPRSPEQKDQERATARTARRAARREARDTAGVIARSTGHTLVDFKEAEGGEPWEMVLKNPANNRVGLFHRLEEPYGRSPIDPKANEEYLRYLAGESDLTPDPHGRNGDLIALQQWARGFYRIAARGAESIALHEYDQRTVAASEIARLVPAVSFR